jgi:hypothetical protein
MFGFFRKKNSLNRIQLTTLDTMAGIVELNLALLGNSEGFQNNLRSNMVRGYFMGFFDACLYAVNQRPTSQEGFAAAMIFAHQRLLREYVQDPALYSSESVLLQDSISYQAGQRVGAEDCFVFLNGNRGLLTGLATAFDVLNRS